MASNDLTAEQLRELLHYDPESGVFTRKVRVAPHCPPGTVAGNTHSEGYVRIKIRGREYLGHRLAFLYMTGAYPENAVDHINGVRSDNRWANLREANHAENMQNRRVAPDISSTGYLGVTRQDGGFVARIRVGPKRTYLGRFNTAEEAHSAYVMAKRKFHPYCTL